VVVADLQDDKGKAVAASINGTFVRTDVTDTEQVIEAVTAAGELGPLRTLVTAAGIGWASRTVGRDGEFASAHDLDLFSKVLSINLIGTFNCIRLAATAMSRTQPVDDDGSKGAIVTLASIAAFDGQIGQAAYAASKGGIAALTLSAARDLADKAIRVMTIAPGVMETPMMAGLPEQARVSLEAMVPHPARLGRPAEYALLVQQIVTNPLLNGESIRLDGALRMPPR
jgi:NAD(P)-dependent dehydrogenase (short-subunit alcohol dehydrogenase family)